MLHLPTRSFFKALLVWSALAGCEGKKTPTTIETSASTAVPKLLSDTVAATPAVAADTAVEVAQELPSGDVPALHIPFEERRKVAPGLVVVIKSIRPADTATIRDPWDIKETFSIVQNGRVIYRDTANGMTYDFSEQPKIRKQYPMWIPTGHANGELLVAFDNRPSKELAKRFHITDGHIAKIDTLPVFNGPAKNLDKDSQMEVAGALAYSEEWDDEHGNDYVSYDPTLYYEIWPTGLVLDSVLTRQKIKEEYGVFKGFAYAEHLEVLVSRLPKASRKRR